MASTVNVSTVLTSNTFDQWRIQTNLLKDDVNEVARGDFVKPTGNVTFTIGRLVLANSTGTMLDVTADGRISGKLSVKNIEQDGGAAYFYSDSGDIQFRADGNFIANGNTRTRYLYNNNWISAANINANGWIYTSGTQSNANLIMNVGGVLSVRSVSNSSNVYVNGNLIVDNTSTMNVLYVTTLYVTDPISAPSESDSDTYRLRVAQATRGTGVFGVFQGTSNGNAAIRFNHSSNTWQSTANDKTTYQTILSTGNLITSTSSTDTANAATPSAVKTTYDAAVAAYNTANAAIAAANAAANTVRVSANSGSTIIKANGINFVNTETITVVVGAGVDGNANISFTSTGAGASEAANAAANTVRVSANGGSTVTKTQLNFVNTAQITVTVEPGTGAATGNANIAFGIVGDVSGPQGPQGVQGTNGTQGPQGTQGLQGRQGVQGLVGEGTQGPQGTIGIQGVQGLQGRQGVQGLLGQGIQGSIGIQGQIGIQGPLGIQGTQGLQGLQGRQGVQGSTGANGTKGDPGIQGSMGIQGQVGQTGQNGAQGAIGIQGIMGIQGTQGLQGLQGVQGPNGPSTNINASADSSTNPLYPVMVSGVGGATPKVHTTQFYFNAATGVCYAYDFATTSDARLKSVMHPLYDAVFKLEQISGVVYNWNDYAKSQFGYRDDIQVGVLAQDVLKVLPEAVHEENGFLRVSYDRLVPLLIEAIKELSERVKQLEGK